MSKVYVRPEYRLTKQPCPHCGRTIASVTMLNGCIEQIDMSQEIVLVEGPKGWQTAGELKFPAFVRHRCAKGRKVIV